MSRYLRVLFFAFVVSAIELSLHLISWIYPKTYQKVVVPHKVESHLSDQRLGVRPNPQYFDHDVRGFRNREEYSAADIVVMGDSQTYGVGVDQESAWPKQLEKKSGMSVYSMAWGGYGPTHYLVLWEEAVSLRPRIVIVAMYSGNDLFDSFKHVYLLGQLERLATTDDTLLDEIKLMEEQDSIEGRLISYTEKLFRSNAEGKSQKSDSKSVLTSAHTLLFSRAIFREMKRLIARDRHSIRDECTVAKQYLASRPGYGELHTDGSTCTVFTSEYRLSAEDLSDSRLREGLQVSLRALGEMSVRAKSANTRFIVLLIPTKEYAFYGRVQAPTLSYNALINNEQKLWDSVIEYLNTNRIEHIDATESLRKAIVDNTQIYKGSGDGHPNRLGYAAIASAVSEYLGRPAK